MQVHVPHNASTDDDGRRDAEPLIREIDRLDGLDALQLLDGQGVAVDTAATQKSVTSPMAQHPCGEQLC